MVMDDEPRVKYVMDYNARERVAKLTGNQARIALYTLLDNKINEDELYAAILEAEKYPSREGS